MSANFETGAPKPQPSPHTIRQALLAMGYREELPGQWLKPVGWHAFSYHEKNNVWTNHFMTGKGKPGCWERQSFQADIEHYGDNLYQLKCFEANTRISVMAGYESRFELNAVDIRGVTS